MFEKERKHMVDYQLKGRGIKNKYVLKAMEEIPRHEFLPEDRRSLAYGDFAVPLIHGQTMSQPFIVAKMIELLDPQPHDKVLEIGSGSGYAAVILSKIVDKVYCVELDKELVQMSRNVIKKLKLKKVGIVQGDGNKGLVHHYPYDKILVSAAAPDVPLPLLEQLKKNGILVIPLGDRMRQTLTKVTKKNSKDIVKEKHDPCIFVPLKGEHGFK